MYAIRSYYEIDGSLIAKMADDQKIYRTVRTIVLFARQLGLEVVAEYVESAATVEALRELGVEYAQGYYFGRPEAQLPPLKPDGAKEER